ncbi:hypothetical protein ACSQ76_12200 [Roseovarius sp. B08]
MSSAIAVLVVMLAGLGINASIRAEYFGGVIVCGVVAVVAGFFV